MPFPVYEYIINVKIFIIAASSTIDLIDEFTFLIDDSDLSQFFIHDIAQRITHQHFVDIANCDTRIWLKNVLKFKKVGLFQRRSMIYVACIDVDNFRFCGTCHKKEEKR